MAVKLSYDFPVLFVSTSKIEDKAVSDALRNLVDILKEGLNTLTENINSLHDDKQTKSDPHSLPSYTVAGVPAAASWTGGMLYVSDESGGAVPAFSDGTNWRRVTDRAIIS